MSTPVQAPPQPLADALSLARADYAALQSRDLSVDLTRGKPSAAQLDLAAALLQTDPDADQDKDKDLYISADGTDCRNYGGDPLGLAELREILSPFLNVPVGQLLAAGNSSLELMHDCLVYALLGGMPGSPRRWADEERIAFLCPVPGYDRHFDLSARLGIELIPVPLTEHGPDMDVVESLVAADPAIKGIWCVPRYSNPDGSCYSEETVGRLAAMPTAAPDFRVFWDDAYAVHHLTDQETELSDIFGACERAGNADRVFVFGSTSKITFAGAGVAFLGSSTANLTWLRSYFSKRSIGSDKVNQLRHARFLRDPEGLRAHMRAHQRILAPKFDAVLDILDRELGGTGLASWSRPKGGYFIALRVPAGCAREVVRLGKEAGISVTPAGSTHPYGKDPEDTFIRIAPSFPSLDVVEQFAYGLTVCVRLAGYAKLSADEQG